MKKYFIFLFMMMFGAGFSSKAQGTSDEIRVKITAGGREMTAVLENNVTTQNLVKQMPMTIPMLDLYGREMCHRFGNGAFPTDHLRMDNYEVGDIVYWAPAGSLVILYRQNGERFSRQHLGHINSGVEVFNSMGDTDVTFEVINLENFYKNLIKKFMS